MFCLSMELGFVIFLFPVLIDVNICNFLFLLILAFQIASFSSWVLGFTAV